MAFDTQRGAILAAIMGRLRTIRKVNGHHVDVKPSSVVCDAVNPFTVPPSELPLFVVEISPSSREYHPANQLDLLTRFVVTGRILVDGTSPARKTEAGENLIGDLERALEGDTTLGGLVSDLRMLEPDGPLMGMGQANNVFVVVELEAHYTREYGLP